jgi:hypothetical protein
MLERLGLKWLDDMVLLLYLIIKFYSVSRTFTNFNPRSDELCSAAPLDF